MLNDVFLAENDGFCSSLAPKKLFLMVLMKLRHAFKHQDLAYRFQVAVTQVSRIFHYWINIMSRELLCLIHWPDREIVRRYLPECFKPTFTRAICIIDCSEVVIQRPTSLVARAQTYSSYKGHNTVKFFLAINPTGAIVFLSKCCGGRVSDKHLTTECGFLRKLLPGDMVLADRGFDIADELALCGASLSIPSFTKGKDQLLQAEVESSRQLSRIHVERTIGRLKNYSILSSTLPVSILKTSTDVSYATIDNILITCAALSNLHPCLV